MEHVNAMDALLTQLHGVLVSAGAGGRPASGASDDGQVTATVAPTGRVTRIEGDPRMLRRPAGDLATAITEAVNDALDAQAADLSSGPDLVAQLTAVQEDTARVMAQATGEYTASMKRMEDLHR